MKFAILLMTSLTFYTQALAQNMDQHATQNIPMNQDNWELTENGAEFVEVDGVDTIHLANGKAIVLDRQLANGIVEFDIMFSANRGFMGLGFRANENLDTAENFYFRSHQENNPDANQYNPIFNNNSSWQLFYGEQYAAPIDYKHDQWQHVKILINGDEAEFYLDSDQPFLHIDDLHTDRATGSLYLTSNFNEAYFSNFSIIETDNVEFLGSTAPYPPAPAGLISSWNASTNTVSFDSLGANIDVDQLVQGWANVNVEQNHIANISRVLSYSADSNTALVRLNISADEATVKPINFGFSDNVKVYVNGLIVFEGSDVYRSRDYRYLGTVGLWDSVYLNLQQGENEVVFAIAENFGGWGIMATIPDQAGLTIH